ncbi:MAG: bifunctional diaminohydroxyphosphoribosylaminopyrimidine deaminase/5-amino-6-(5-phosphoribosylamino)uracil reductase RibD, partial [Acidimicrobiales bacterium]|nr:bifunctional diaminohydroxyphosphoribosylaminopyrimidine deaminase/5-amino-6-(5-phosphoribosylamino)uracil reductase RibD [Acidimicrobiales bacterium]
MTETSGVVPPDQVGAGDWMAKAIAMAQTARRCVSPRPWVGAVLVTAAGRWFAGATDGRTGPHAEIVALSNARAAGIDPAGATMYVTLEPCAHHGQTPPCADALVEAGIRRVVVAITDPDPQVSGRGIERLRAAGIDVEIGPGSEQVRGQLAPYLKHRRTGQPYVVLKLAATLDGRIAAPDGSGRWITGPQARLDAHRLRADSDAILVGAGTVRADDPSLTVRLPEGEEPGSEPLRVVLGSVPAKAAVQPALAMAGPLDEVLTELGARGVLQLMVEGGASVAHAFHHAGLVDRYVVYVAPALFGGDDAKAMFAGPGAPTIT